MAAAVRTVLKEEGSRLGLNVKVQEGSGLSLKRSVVTSDLAFGQPCPQGTVPFALLVVARVAFTTIEAEQFTAAIVNFVVRTL